MNFDKITSAWVADMGNTTVIFGDIVNGMLVVAEFSAKDFSALCGRSVKSDLIAGTNLRWGRSKPNSKAVKALATNGKAVMTEAEFLQLAKGYANKGNAFEAAMVTYYNGEPTAPNTPHTDFTLEGKKFECKFSKNATVANGEYLHKAGLITFDEATQESKS